MPYNESINQRIENIIADWNNMSSKKMFGGICHLMHGNMIGGVYKDYLILRLGEEHANNALTKPNVRPFDITGRPMKGWVMVSEAGFSDDDILLSWLLAAKKFVKKLPPK